MPIWIVEGADKSTGREVARSIEAMTQAEAEQSAAREGILVASVRIDSDAPVVGAIDALQKLQQDAARDMRDRIFDLHGTLREIEDHAKVIRGWITFIGVLVLLAVIGWVLQIFAALIQAGSPSH